MVTKIQISEVAKRYEGKNPVDALSDVSLTVADNEFVCLVGPSGCGKSTLLRMIMGLHRPNSGTLDVFADDPDLAPTAMVFQDYSIYPWKTVEQNVRFGFEGRRLPRSECDARVEKWLHRLGLAPFRTAYPAALSGGMRQRVSIARALAVEPEVLLMDEPFAALDAQLRRVLQEELLSLWQHDRRTVVFVTHSLEEAILLGDRIVVMSARPGQIIADVEVPFERPRSPEIRTATAFAELEGQIWARLRDEVDRALVGGAP